MAANFSLSQPIGPLVREAPILYAGNSLLRAAEVLRTHAFGIAFVVQEGQYLGAVTESSLMRAQAAGHDPLDAVESAVVIDLPILPASATGADALRFFDMTGVTEAIVVDAQGRPHGLITPSDLYPKTIIEPRPAMVGGMATPFGVYLTNGTIRAGVGDWALLSTGALLFLVFVAASLASNQVELLAVRFLPRTNWVLPLLENALPLLLFLIGVRSLPLSGIHAAEHKVVHAIEMGEPLEPVVVGRMSRVHPRCGTNIAAGASLFLGISSAPWIANEEVRLLAAIFATLFFWRPLGSLMQLYVTTRPPNAKQLDMGIRAGRDLLSKFQTNRAQSPNPLVRLWASGMLHVMAGSSLAFFALDGISRIFNFDIVL